MIENIFKILINIVSTLGDAMYLATTADCWS